MTSDMLRSAFRANGTFSLASGALFLLLGGSLAPWTGLPAAWPLQAIGAGLLPFGAWLWWLAGRPGLEVRTGWIVCMMDAQWVVGTGVLLVGWPELLNPTGRVLAVAIAAVVTGFALWQWQGTRRLEAAA